MARDRAAARACAGSQAPRRLTELLDEAADAVGAAGADSGRPGRQWRRCREISRLRATPSRRSRRLMDDLSQWIWIVTFWWAFVHLWADEPMRPRRRHALRTRRSKRSGRRATSPSIAHSLAAIAYAQGRYDEAEELTRECEEACHANDIHSQIMWRAIRAKVLARRGELRRGRTRLRHEPLLSPRRDFLLAHADALRDLGEVLELAGSRDEAARAFERAIELYEQKGVLSAAARTQRRSRATRARSSAPIDAASRGRGRSRARPRRRAGTSRGASARSASGCGCRGARGPPSPSGSRAQRARR